MAVSSLPLLLVAAGTLGFLHSVLPDHWMPLAVVARTQRWSVARVARTSLLASIGHVLTSIILAGVIAAIGLQFRKTFETEQGHIVGAILMATGIGFCLWGFLGPGHQNHHHQGSDHDDDIERPVPAIVAGANGAESKRPGSSTRGIAGIIVPFGAAASPDLTVLPVALAAAGIGIGAVLGVLAVFSAATLGTFVVLTVAATLAGYQIKGEWLEEHGMLITGGVLIVIGGAVFSGL